MLEMSVSKVKDSINIPNLGAIGDIGAIPSWVEAVDQEGINHLLPKRTETTSNGIKTIVDFVEDSTGKCKVVTTYKVVHKKVPRIVAERKKWKKFGQSLNESPGPQVNTTYVADEVEIQFLKNRDERQDELDEKSDPLMKGSTSKGHCRFCKSDEHWSVNCPYKAMYQGLQIEEESDASNKHGLKQAPHGQSTGKYVNPMQRGDRVIPERRPDDFTCRVTNLPEDSETLDQDLRTLFGSVGRVDRFFLARDKATNKPKGFAFITYSNRMDAEKAIEAYNGYRMHHLVMKVEWTKSQS